MGLKICLGLELLFEYPSLAHPSCYVISTNIFLEEEQQFNTGND